MLPHPNLATNARAVFQTLFFMITTLTYRESKA